MSAPFVSKTAILVTTETGNGWRASNRPVPRITLAREEKTIEDLMPPQVEKLASEFRLFGVFLLALGLAIAAWLIFEDWYYVDWHYVIESGAARGRMYRVLRLLPLRLLGGAVVGLPFVIEATAIKKGRTWAKAVGVVLAVLALPLFPIGTILSWVWFYRFSTPEARQYFRWCR
jgi:hypothetical protein